MVRVYPILFILFGLVRLAAAHNGAVAIAVPVEGITIDGDLSDWPEDIPWQRLHRSQGNNDMPSEVQHARFAVGYHVAENALYVAVIAPDESHVLEADPANWDTSDGCELYVDALHLKEDTRIGHYQIYSSRTSVWRGARLKDFDVGARRDQMELASVSMLGVEVRIFDRDEDGSFTILQSSWKAGASSAYFTDLVLHQPLHDGRLEGHLQRSDGQNAAWQLVEIRSLDNLAFQLVVQTDPEGAFALSLPAGSYRLSAGKGYVSDVKVVAEQTTQHDVEIEPPQGNPVAAGPGKSTRAQGRRTPSGAGVQRGAWSLFNVANGLPDGTVIDMIEARTILCGLLWGKQKKARMPEV